ncbi:hypothetical protein C5B99_12245 [Pseudoclavibacter sp. Z016]|nr:hypothetical protein C5B99_12245 [Pseudoclavibacter sp. Z016]
MAAAAALACGIGVALITAPVAQATELTEPPSPPASDFQVAQVDGSATLDVEDADGAGEAPEEPSTPEPSPEPEPTTGPEPTVDPEPTSDRPEPAPDVVPDLIVPAVNSADAISATSTSPESFESDAPAVTQTESVPLAATGSDTQSASLVATGAAALVAGLAALGIGRRVRRS